MSSSDDAADGGEEPGRVGLPLLDGAHALEASKRVAVP